MDGVVVWTQTLTDRSTETYDVLVDIRARVPAWRGQGLRFRGRVIVGVHHGARATARKSVAVLCAEPVAVRRTEAVSAFGRLLGRGQLRACERRSKRERRVSRERGLLCDGLLCDVRVRVP